MRQGRVAREARRTAAEARQAERGKRTDEQQLHKLINDGHGHCKEAQHLAEQIGDEIQETLEFCRACGASIPGRYGEGRCDQCMEVGDD